MTVGNRSIDVGAAAKSALAAALASGARTIYGDMRPPEIAVETHELGTWLRVTQKTRFTQVTIGVVVDDAVTPARVASLTLQLLDRAASMGMRIFGPDPDGRHGTTSCSPMPVLPPCPPAGGGL